MPDDITLPLTGAGDGTAKVRAKDRGTQKTQVFLLDLNTAGNEDIVTGAVPVGGADLDALVAAIGSATTPAAAAGVNGALIAVLKTMRDDIAALREADLPYKRMGNLFSNQTGTVPGGPFPQWTENPGLTTEETYPTTPTWNLIDTAIVSKSYAVVASTDVFTVTAHGYANGQAVIVSAATAGAPLVVGTVYYVRDVTANTFKLAATFGGAAINITTDGTGTVQTGGLAPVTIATPTAGSGARIAVRGGLLTTKSPVDALFDDQDGGPLGTFQITRNLPLFQPIPLIQPTPADKALRLTPLTPVRITGAVLTTQVEATA